MHEVLGFGEELPHVYSRDDALPGAHQTSKMDRWPSRQVGFPARGSGPRDCWRIQITRTRKISGFDFEPRDRGDLCASAMDLDVAIARLIGNGPATRRLPRALSWDGEDLCWRDRRSGAGTRPRC